MEMDGRMRIAAPLMSTVSATSVTVVRGRHSFGPWASLRFQLLQRAGLRARAQAAQRLVLTLLFCCSLSAAGAITVNGALTNQVVDGFGVNVNFRSWNGTELQPVLDAFIDQAGMTLFRVVHDLSDWEATNDNTNASSINWDSFNGVFASGEFPKLWDLFAYLNSRSITNGAYFCFMGWGPPWMMGTDGHTLKAGMEEEWAETITAAVRYARNTRGLQFSLLAPDNEPEQDAEGIRMSVSIYTNALHRLALKLDANGLGDLGLVGPDTILDPSYLPAMLADPVVMAKVGRVGLHSYGGGGQGSTGIAALLTNSPYPSLPFWMTEFNVSCTTCDHGTRGTYDWDYCEGTAAYLLSHLLNGASGGVVWEGYDSVYAHDGYQWSYWGLFSVDDETAPVKTYTPRKNLYTLSQITKWVRPGAQRIGISGSAGSFSPLVAFLHPASGQVTLVGINTATTAASLSGTLASLPSLTHLDLFYTTATTNLASGSSVAVSNGVFSALIPADSVFTLTGAPGIWARVTAPAAGAQFVAPADIPIQATVVPDSASVGLVEFYQNATKLGEVTNAPYALTWAGAPMGDYALTARVHETGGNVTTSAVVQVSVTGPLTQIRVTPTNSTVAIGSTQQFQATGLDELGHALGAAVSWSVNGGGTISSNGVFSAAGLPGYLYWITAASGSVTGLAPVIVSVPTGVLGNSNEGSLTDGLWSNGAYIQASRVRATNSFTATLVSAKVAAVSGHYKCAVYADNAGVPGVLLGGTAEVANPGTGWQIFPLIPWLAITNGQRYWLALWSDSPNAEAYYTGSGGTLRWGAYSYGAWPTTLATTGGSSVNYCIYAASTVSVLSSIALVPVNVEVFPTETERLAALGINTDGTTTNLTLQSTWLSADPSVASVSAGGLVTGFAPGSTTLSASVQGLTGSVTLAVLERPQIQSIQVADGTATVSWTAAPNHAYRLQYVDDLGSSNWVDLEPDVFATDTTASATDFMGDQPVRFYRVLVVR
jgi:O-glycosyl hydrolase